MPTPRITRTNCTGFTRCGLVAYVVEASSLELPPGEFPGQIEADPDIGNGQPFIRKHWLKNPDGELESVEYWQAFGSVQLTVLND